VPLVLSVSKGGWVDSRPSTSSGRAGHQDCATIERACRQAVGRTEMRSGIDIMARRVGLGGSIRALGVPEATGGHNWRPDCPPSWRALLQPERLPRRPAASNFSYSRAGHGHLRPDTLAGCSRSTFRLVAFAGEHEP